MDQSVFRFLRRKIGRFRCIKNTKKPNRNRTEHFSVGSSAKSTSRCTFTFRMVRCEYVGIMTSSCSVWCQVVRIVNRLGLWLGRFVVFSPKVSIGFRRFAGVPYRYVGVAGVGDGGKRRNKPSRFSGFVFFRSGENPTKHTRWSFLVGKNRTKATEKNNFRFSVHNPDYVVDLPEAIE